MVVMMIDLLLIVVAIVLSERDNGENNKMHL